VSQAAGADGASTGADGASAGADVRVEHAGRRYGSVDALRDANLHVAPGEFLAVTGRSGSGKARC
jgi:ABC-type Fe3+/spermidine/putrescine transport system ATPase subunit